MSTSKNNRQKKQFYRILILLLLILLLLCIQILIHLMHQTDPVLPPDYPLPDDEKYAQTIPNDSTDKMESEDGGGSVNLTYSDRVIVSLQEQKIFLQFANPGRSDHCVTLGLTVEETQIVQSGILSPGYQVNQLDLSEKIANSLSPGQYAGTLVVEYYDPDSGEKALLTTNIPVTVTVSP